MARLMSEMYYGRREPAWLSTYGPQYYPDVDMPSSSAWRMPPDVQFWVPMESKRDVEKVKEALDIRGVKGVTCDIPTQTVIVSGIVPVYTLLRKIKHVKRKSRLLTLSSPNSPLSPSYGYEDYEENRFNNFYEPSMLPFSSPYSYGSRSRSYDPVLYDDSYYEDYRPSFGPSSYTYY